MPTSHQTALAAWIDHTGGKRTETESVILSGLTQAYPGTHIARTSASKCDVLGYGNAGFATVTPWSEAGYDATRVFRAPQSRLDDAKGKLEDVVNFAKWKFEYDGNEFIIYEVTYMDQFAQVIKIQYVLAQCTNEDTDGLHNKKTDELLLAAGAWTNDVHEQVWVYEDQEWSKSRSLWQSVQGSTWEDVVLEPSMRAKLHRDIHGFFDNRELYRKARIPWKRGIIFHGKPGNGKSMTLAVTINQLAKRDPPIPALYVKSLDACSGPKWSLQQIFKKARKTAPCLLVCEDLDSLVTDNTRSYFLNQVDGLESNDGILIIGSTNHLDRLDTAVTKRPSRFDRKYHFKLPEEAERLAYCRYWRNKFVDGDSADLKDFDEDMCAILAKWTEGYSFAYLKELFVTALLLHTHGSDADEDDRSGEQAVKSPVDGLKETANGDRPVTNGEHAAKECRPATTNGEVSSSTNASTGDEDREDKSAPRTLPDIPIPDHLQHSGLLRIFRRQAQTLLEEMDHSAGSDERKATGPAGDPPIKFRIPSLLDDEGDE